MTLPLNASLAALSGDTGVDAFVWPAGFTLAIEASTAHGSLALFRSKVLVDHEQVQTGTAGNDVLFSAIEAMLLRHDIRARSISAIVCGSGPGSFTSLRIAAATAKGLSHGAQIPLFSVSSLILATGKLRLGNYLLHADALRDERYALPVLIDNDGYAHEAGSAVRGTLADIAKLPGLPVDATLVNLSRGELHSAHEASAHEASAHEASAPEAAALLGVHPSFIVGPVNLSTWEPAYGRLAEAQVKWEAAHGTSLAQG